MAVDDSGLAGDLENGFRPKGNCSDNVFILNYKLPINVQKTFLSFLLFVDLIAAYNMVDRGMLFRKMEIPTFQGNWLPTWEDYVLPVASLPEPAIPNQLPAYQGQLY